MLSKISEACRAVDPDRLQIHVPVPLFFIDNTDDVFWHENLERFPEEHRRRSRALCMERVLPLVQPVREALIDLYCPQELRAQARKLPAEKDCLVRVYLRKSQEQLQRVKKPLFSLRNYKLHLDQMLMFGLEIYRFAESMADALAIMHWGVGIDGSDVEFVLGSAPDRTTGPAAVIVEPLSSDEIAALPPNTSTWTRHINNFKQRVTHLWLLDFNKCKCITRDQIGIEQAVKAFYINDPYFPRPCGATDAERLLWDCFYRRYIETSSRYVKDKTKDLPTQFVDMLVKEQKNRNEIKRIAAERARRIEEQDD